MKRAIVIGSTGMVGTQLIQLLLNTETYTKVVSFVRRPSGVFHPKLTEHVIDFNKPDEWGKLITGDVLFSTLGTTLAQAKSKKAQFEVDFTYQYRIAEMAAKNGVPNYVLISSAGANSKSKAFYLNMKGQLEDAVLTLPFNVISILQPGQLAGNRTEKRWSEQWGLNLMYALNKIGWMKRYRPISAEKVALAMLHAAQKSSSGTYKLNEVFQLIEQ